MGVLAAIGELIDFLIREIYRAAHVRWEMDSADAQSADAIRLQHTELNEMLANLAAELQRVELEWCGSGSTGVPRERRGIDKAFDDAKIVIAYPNEFFVADLLEDLQKWANAIKLDLGRRSSTTPSAASSSSSRPRCRRTLKTIHDEIEAQAVRARQAMADAQTARASPPRCPRIAGA
jgi:hypothetical protein